MKKQLLFLGLMIQSVAGFTQLTNWIYRTPITITENQGATLSNYIARVIVDTQTPIAAGNMMPQGEDIRFSMDTCGATLINYWIESGINTSSTVIYVEVPSLAASTQDTVMMFYGNNTASAASDINSVFTNYYVSGGQDTTMTGTVNFEYLNLEAGDSIHVVPGAPLVLDIQYIRIDGVLNGRGAGYAGGPVGYVNGSGPGGGTFLSGDASSGGGYGGDGGDGGADSGAGAAGGTANGNALTLAIDMGSGGGSSDDAVGGNGGAAVTFMSEHLTVSGTVNVDGDSASFTGTNTGRAGGSGAGGGVLVHADEIDFTGIITANGGDGHVGPNSANDGGGGGGGGRVKLFYNGSLNNTGTIQVNGGAGGVGPSSAPGQPGSPGTQMDSLTIDNTTTTVALGTDGVNPCGPAASVEDFTAGAFNVYPNPTNGVLSIESTVQESVNIHVLDITGKVVLEEYLFANDRTTLDLSSYESGMYFVRLVNDSKSKTIKVVLK